MDAIITIAVKNNGADNASGAVVTDPEGRVLAEVSAFYEKSNKVYAAYKTLIIALSMCRRLGVREIVVEEKDVGVRNEIQGELNRNQKLNRMFRDRIKQYGYACTARIADESTDRYKAAMTLADRGMSTRKIICHVY